MFKLVDKFLKIMFLNENNLEISTYAGYGLIHRHRWIKLYTIFAESVDK